MPPRSPTPAPIAAPMPALPAIAPSAAPPAAPITIPPPARLSVSLMLAHPPSARASRSAAAVCRARMRPPCPFTSLTRELRDEEPPDELDRGLCLIPWVVVRPLNEELNGLVARWRRIRGADDGLELYMMGHRHDRLIGPRAEPMTHVDGGGVQRIAGRRRAQRHDVGARPQAKLILSDRGRGRGKAQDRDRE